MAKNLRLYFLISLEYFKRNWQLVLFGTAVFLVSVFFAIKFNLISTSVIFSEGFIGTYQQHDLPLEVTRLISSGLVEATKDGKVVPKLAASWQTNSDATQFTFKLKPDLRWSDGSIVKSSDLEIVIPDVEVSYPNDKEVLIKLKESYSPFPTLLTKPLYKRGSLMGVGPYQVTKIEKSRIFITKILLTPVDSKLPTVAVRFYPNEKVAITGFNLGEVQVLLGFSNIMKA